MNRERPKKFETIPEELPFFWGAATSAHQVEGDNQFSDWWRWEREGHIEGGIVSGKASDHRRLFKEDLCVAAELGLNSYRFSIEWARVEPQPGKFCEEALQWYRELVDECFLRGITPMVTLHHFTLPDWVARRGGWENPEILDWFRAYVVKVIGAIGKKVWLWCTVNEPMVVTVGGYLSRFMPPAKQDPQAALMVCHHLFRAHVIAYDLLHSWWQDPSLHNDGESMQGLRTLYVGPALNFLDFAPDRWWDIRERVITFFARRFYNEAWLEALVGKKTKFHIPLLVPSFPHVFSETKRKTADFIGVNYYTKALLQWRRNRPVDNLQSGLPVQVAFSRVNDETSDMGWAVHPEGLLKTLKRVHKKTKLPIWITENGIADRDDSKRSSYIRSHLIKVAQALQQGITVRGYYYWSLLDNFEWIKGFGPRFGLIEVDYTNQNRQIRPSALLYAQWIRLHQANIPTPCGKNRGAPDEDTLTKS